MVVDALFRLVDGRSAREKPGVALSGGVVLAVLGGLALEPIVLRQQGSWRKGERCHYKRLAGHEVSSFVSENLVKGAN